MNALSRRSLLKGSAAVALGFGTGIGLTSKIQPVFAQPAVDSSALDDLRARLAGTLMLPDDSGYLDASATANGRYLDIRPIAVARCQDEADVVTCINWCTENGVAPAARGGGHSYAGFSATTGLQIDMKRITDVQIDWDNGTATCGGAASNGNFFTATENGPMFLPGGTCLGVGTGGLTLGGGIGYNAHWAGLTCDHLASSRIVTADGQIRDIDPANHTDLYWACRGGGGGNFGINTTFTFNLVEIPTDDVAYYSFHYRGKESAAAVLSAFDTLMQNAPSALNAVAMAQATEVGVDGPDEAIDVMTRGQFIGSLDELHDLVDPLLDVAPAVQQEIGTMPFWSYQRQRASPETAPHSWGDISRYANGPVPASTYDELADLIAQCPSRSADASGALWSLGWIGGDVIGSFSRTETAYVHRTATTMLRPTTVWPNDADESVGNDLNDWSLAMVRTMEPHVLDEAYQNFANTMIDNWPQQYYAENWERLVDIKTKYDPDNMFHQSQSIPVRSGS